MTWKNALLDDVRYAVDNDRYMWLVIWGPPRLSKTTLLLWILYSLYRDWDTVLSTLVFTLGHLVYKMKDPDIERWWTLNGLHHRIPGIGWDDYGGHSNKAVTQHDRAWDIFKGGFDVLGTKLGFLGATMVDPSEPTLQLTNKYTHEIEILEKGYYKYDEVFWIQDFKGWKFKIKKHFVEYGEFDPVPDEVYKRYDELRMSLADEIMVKLEDAITTTNQEFVVKMLRPPDFKMLEHIEFKGGSYNKEMREMWGPKYIESLTRLKANGCVVPHRISEGHYRYNMTRLGKDVLDHHRELEKEEENIFAQ
jgi:hypothetical protein